MVTIISKTKDHSEEVLPDSDPKDQDYDPDKHEFISQILAAKAHVTPLNTGLTILRSDSQNFYYVQGSCPEQSHSTVVALVLLPVWGIQLVSFQP